MRIATILPLCFVAACAGPRITPFAPATPPAAAATPAASAAPSLAPPAAFSLTSPSRPGAKPVPIEAMFDTTRVDGAWPSPDGMRLVYAGSATGRTNLWIADVATGATRALTKSDQRQLNPSFSPDGHTIAFQSDKDGDEQWDLFVVRDDGTGLVNLTATPDVSDSGPVFSPDGRSLVFSRKPRTGAATEVALIDVATKKVRMLTKDTPPGKVCMAPFFSRDGKQVVYSLLSSDESDGDVYVVDLATGAARDTTPHEGKRRMGASDMSADGRRVLVTYNPDGTHNAVGVVDVASGAVEPLVSDAWDASGVAFTPDGRSAVIRHDVEGDGDMALVDLATKKVTPLPLPQGVNQPAGRRDAVTRAGDALFYQHAGADAVSDLGVLTLATGQARTVVSSMPPTIERGDLVRPTLVHYPSKDGKWTISAFVYVPYNLAKDGRAPAAVWVHGGPTGQYQNGFNRFVEALSTRGYVVIAPNVRGSSGYGDAFMYANKRDWGGGDLEDVRTAAEELVRTGFVDPHRIAVLGGSYGGYMTLMALTKQPDFWAAGVSMVPFVNLFTEFEREDPELREYDRSFMGDPNENRALWMDRSPINFADRVRAPLLLFAGGNDPRDPPTETTQFADAVRAHGGSRVEVKVYADEGHVFSKRENQIDELRRTVEFLEESTRRR